LFDRRCRRVTALWRLLKLRQRVRRFKRLARALGKLSSPVLAQALLFLDDRLLGATTNAVERANRRFRKAQKSIYGVRTTRHLRIPTWSWSGSLREPYQLRSPRYRA
jgi:hypothetical protein